MGSLKNLVDDNEQYHKNGCHWGVEEKKSGISFTSSQQGFSTYSIISCEPLNKCFIVAGLDRLRVKLHICVHISTLNKNPLQQTKQPNSIPIRGTLSVKPVNSYLTYIRCSLKKVLQPIESQFPQHILVSDRPHIFFCN